MIAHRINAERLVLFGWTRAILLQMAHPLIAAGVTRHSAFRGRVSEAAVRLHHTLGAMLALNFGTDADRQETIARIRAIHRGVRGTLATPAGPFPAGTTYSAEDPALLLWVHATLLDSTAKIYQHLVAPLTREELDAYCVESAPLVEALGGNPALTPLSWPALQDYMEATYASGVLAITDEARAIAWGVLAPRAAGFHLPVGRIHRLVGIGMLPPRIRDDYGFPWDAAHERRLARAIRVIRLLRHAAPPRLAQWRASRTHHRP